jgi:hypothetical protein
LRSPPCYKSLHSVTFQIEEPFSILPLEALCDGSIYNVLSSMVKEEDEVRRNHRRIEASREGAPPVEGAHHVEAAPFSWDQRTRDDATVP